MNALLGTFRGAVGHHHDLSDSQKVIYVAVLVIGLIGIAATILMTTRIKCPKCGTRLGRFAARMGSTQRTRAIYCPFCGVNLDQPLPEVQTAAENVTTPDKLVWK